MVDMRYPVGRFQMPEVMTAELRQEWIEEIAQLPAKLRSAVKGLTPEQLDTPYRAGGWTVRQVVHHIADSHMNSFTRFKLAVTESEPTIKLYDEKAWAETPDANGPIEPSVAIIDGLHARWTILLHSMTPDQFQRTYRHPESGVGMLERLLGLYAWHSRHHVAHVTSLRDRTGW